MPCRADWPTASVRAETRSARTGLFPAGAVRHCGLSDSCVAAAAQGGCNTRRRFAMWRIVAASPTPGTKHAHTDGRSVGRWTSIRPSASLAISVSGMRKNRGRPSPASSSAPSFPQRLQVISHDPPGAHTRTKPRHCVHRAGIWHEGVEPEEGEQKHEADDGDDVRHDWFSMIPLGKGLPSPSMKRRAASFSSATI